MNRWIIVLLLFFFSVPMVAQAGMPGFMKKRMGILSGQVISTDGKPIPGGIVSFFNTKKGIPPLVANMHRIPDTISGLATNGRFSVKLLPGSYYMGALIITDPGRGPGPPRKGETFYFVRNNKGNLRKLTLGKKEVKDVGQIIGALPNTFPVVKNLGTIEGRIVHDDGHPYEGAYVMLKQDMNSQRPDFVSPRTGKDGHFLLKVPPGKYYILARHTIIGGKPRIGDLVGVYGKNSLLGGALPGSGVKRLNPGIPSKNATAGNSGKQTATELNKEGQADFYEGIGAIQAGQEAVAVELTKNKILTGINITLYEVPDPVGTRKKFLNEGQSRDNSDEFQAPFKKQNR